MRYYLFKVGANIKIVPLSDQQAAVLREHGRDWIGDPQETEKDAENLKAALLSNPN
jgi:hypothetical protein